MDYTELKEKIKKRIKVNPKTNCWEWQGCKDQNGYGQLTFKRKRCRVHRVMMDAKKGEQVNHHCDNPRCCNPDHLYFGTQSQNMKDGVRRGRVIPPIHRPKLDKHSIYGIEILLKNIKLLGITQDQIAKMFNISSSQVSNVKYKRTWNYNEN